MKSPLTLALAGLLAASMATPVLAQPYDAEYQRQMREYERQREIYEQNQRDYEARYGAYQRGVPPRAEAPRYDDRRGDPYRDYANSPCERRTDNTAAGTVIGALVGAALGANVAAPKVQTEGAILGAVVGGAFGASIANSADNNRYAAHCDAQGYYFAYDQTYAYREDRSMRGRRSGRYDSAYYARMRCRLAVAPADWNGRSEYRYVRVCPDRQDRYRITG